MTGWIGTTRLGDEAIDASVAVPWRTSILGIAFGLGLAIASSCARESIGVGPSRGKPARAAVGPLQSASRTAVF
jgi:hypothetical protein